MHENRTAELRRFMTAISDPNIRPILDLKKLCQSGTYHLAVQMATEHAIQHGDFGYLQKILIVLDDSIYVDKFIASLRPKLSFIITEKKPHRFKIATPEQAAKAEKRAQNKQAANTAANASKPMTKRAEKAATAKSSAAAIPKKRKVKAVKVGHDIMDSRLMLPGGYGTGRRR
jgi:hypothetical protein